MTTALQPMTDLGRHLTDQCKQATGLTIGLKLSHCSDQQLVFEEVADCQLDWLYQQLDALLVPHVLREEHLHEDLYRVTLYLA